MNKVFSLDEICSISLPLAEKYGVDKLYIFGSYARKEATETSDIDLLIDKGDIRNLLDYFAFVSDLEDGFGKHVDVVTTTCNDREFVDRAIKEAILIYELKGQNSYTENLAVL